MIDALSAASPAVVAALVAALAFVIASLALGAARRRRDRVQTALDSLSAMKWSEFAHHVVGVLSQRGLRQDDLDRHPGKEGFDILMTRGAARYLVQCKQVGSRGLGERVVREFADTVRLQGAEGGILVSTGPVDAAARRAADSVGIELMPGVELWRQLRPLLPVDLVGEIEQSMRLRRGRKALLALAISVAAGALAYLLAGALGLPAAAPERPTAAAPVAASTQAAPAPSAAAPAPSPDASVQPLPIALPDPDLSEAELATRRATAESLLRQLPQVADAAWSTHSTLLLTLHRDGDDPIPEAAIRRACEALVRYEELRFTRLQVHTAEPRTEDEAGVRWRQCR